MARAHPVHMGAPLPRLAVATPTALLQGLCASGTARLAAPGANDDKDFRDPAPLSSRTGRRAGNSNCSSARTTPLTSAQPSARVISPHDMCRGMVLLEEDSQLALSLEHADEALLEVAHLAQGQG